MIMTIANKMRIRSKKLEDVSIVKKIPLCEIKVQLDYMFN